MNRPCPPGGLGDLDSMLELIDAQQRIITFLTQQLGTSLPGQATVYGTPIPVAANAILPHGWFMLDGSNMTLNYNIAPIPPATTPTTFTSTPSSGVVIWSDGKSITTTGTLTLFPVNQAQSST